MKKIKRKKYPTARVISAYGLMGSTFGGVIMGFFLVLLCGFTQPLLFIMTLSISILYGFVLGLIPALLTGIIIAKLKVRENGFHVSLIGGFTSFLCSLLLPIVLYQFIIFIIITGAISAYLVGLIALPKSTKKSTD